ncbi:Haloacid Dehalogenase Superfamily Class (subfamily) IIA/haloacid dehalogenase superfamily, subfamily IA, variant 1 with third motif having Dx(3-4)D or Dx(3-4)E [Lentzea albidocapillata subsp. violacea]|uniref:Haloacid Dehalogenase Superfamily Class (Subfamily) IIA/haloacid dehalogenase superfamily, subfamily IA, variant 1 with third motif having Dx(3-4)D or Dx(3-4)E n=1 Tax=Lentzea albidocapillata subsp. violacea TaxID=128104 RepID=A0A1G9IRI5_9PSEU|nr:HAD-IIA family hydrolase [Lentzea albidocapillata]SDL27675.1 Haloacid Dehalogenase Superfamily Class (subfamily) IIA/haloacid dehalogenase superfamily, subfamily IA, variant 1 with third motif having Dx(3-4)D or Dx(3-4)E [Lentzea albidocapillata subsp. violacea]
MSTLADEFDGFIIDLDGVVHLGWTPLPGAIDTLTTLMALGKRIVFLTNDPRYGRAAVAARLRGLGAAVDDDSVITSGWAAAVAVAAAGGSVYVIGSDELCAEVRAAGAPVVGAADAGRAENILVGGHSGFDYAELTAACRAGDNGARLFATNRDATFPMPDGPWPATGAILAAVETALGRRAISIGKPETGIFTIARDRLGVDRVAVIGDRPDTDIVGGRRAGLATILVQDGSALPLPAGDHRPDHVIPDLAGLVS